MLSHECFDNKTMGNILFICLLFYVVKLRNIINCIIIENASSNVIGCSLVVPWVFLECYLVVPWFFLSCWLPARLLHGYLVIPWVLLDCSWLLLVCWFAGLLICWFAGLLVCWFVGLLVCWFAGLLSLLVGSHPQLSDRSRSQIIWNIKQMNNSHAVGQYKWMTTRKTLENDKYSKIRTCSYMISNLHEITKTPVWGDRCIFCLTAGWQEAN